MAVQHVQKSEIIQHELGHWVVARNFNILTDHIKINKHGNSYSGHSNILMRPKFSGISDVKLLIEARICTLMAGTVAQIMARKYCGNSDVDKIFQSNAKNDYDKIHEYYHLISGFNADDHIDDSNYEEVLRALQVRYWKQTQAIVEEHRENIFKLRDYIASRVPKKQIFTNEELLSALSGE